MTVRHLQTSRRRTTDRRWPTTNELRSGWRAGRARVATAATAVIRTPFRRGALRSCVTGRTREATEGSPRMRLQSERPDPDTQVIHVIGDLEGPDAQALASVPSQTDPPPQRRVIDLGAMTFIDSYGMQALLQLADATSSDGGETVLVLDDDSYVRRLLEIRGVIDRFRVVATRTEALAL